MNIIINCVHPEGLTPDEQVFIQLLRTDIKLLESLMSKSLLIVNKEHLVSNGYILAWKDSLSEIILSNKKVPKSQNITDWIDNYRNVFKNKKAGAMGSKKSCVEKMLKFVKDYPEYSDPELIVSAATRYVNTQRISRYDYLQRADYVISKKDSDSVTSRLAAFCEEIIENENKVEVFNQAGRQTI
tara:strand:- start:65 stop:619 length:555 start_codon:yes stop_codon:yes gene_type:complete